MSYLHTLNTFWGVVPWPYLHLQCWRLEEDGRNIKQPNTILTRQQLHLYSSWKSDGEQIFQGAEPVGESKDHKQSSELCVTKRNQFYGKELYGARGITLLFKFPTSDINDVKYDQGYQNKNGQ